MGKTQKGAVWLDENKTSPYESYQYWRNTADDDVEKCFKLLTFLPLEEIAELCAHRDERINAAQERLAFELTKLVHGEEKAALAQAQARAAFGGEGEMEVRQRMSDTLTEIMERDGHAPALAVSHGGSSRQFMRCWEKNHKAELKRRV